MGAENQDGDFLEKRVAMLEVGQNLEARFGSSRLGLR